MMIRTIAILAAVAVAAPALAQSGQVKGYTVRDATHSLGSYRQGNGKEWNEYNDRAQKTFSFIEQARDEWSVYLLDPSRNVRIQIDLFRKKIRYADADKDYSDLYDVTGSYGSNATAPPPPPVPSSQKTFDIVAGPIWNQGDAESKCPRIAWGVKGTWTGQWSTLVPNQASTCQIRF